MVELIKIKTQNARRHLIDEAGERLQAGQTTWVVADVRSKLALQRKLMTRSLQENQIGFVSGYSVLRASEIWNEAIRHLEPELQIVSNELMLALIAKELRDLSNISTGENREWLKAPGAAKTAFSYMGQLLPILSAEATFNEGMTPLGDWLESEETASVTSRQRWKSWYEVSAQIWRNLHHKKLCTSGWAAAWLVAKRESLAGVFSRDFIFDLGAQLTHVEAELILSIASAANTSPTPSRIQIIRPLPSWESDYPDVRLAADWILQQAEIRGIDCVERILDESQLQGKDEAVAIKSADRKSVYKRLPSAAAEVKEATAKVRQWLEQGVAPETIAIASPNIEDYWPVLSLHLVTEGIPVNKARVSMLHSFPDMMKWLARLRTRTGVPSPRDLEADIFGVSYTHSGGKDLKPFFGYEKFREVFSRVYEASDMDLSPDLLQYFQNEFHDDGRWLDKKMTIHQFLQRAVALLRPSDDLGRAIRVLKKIFEECPPNIEFQLSEWVEYLGQSLARIEVTTDPADPSGIWCLNLSSLDGVGCDYVFALGLNDGAIRVSRGTAIQSGDMYAIERDLGYVIDGEDRKRAEFEIRWILQEPRCETHLLFADSDMSGVIQTPSWAWLSGAWESEQKIPEIQIPAESRFDFLLKRPFEKVGTETQRERLLFEKGERPPARFGEKLFSRLSASRIDAIAKCPLQFAFDQILSPRYLGEIDLDVDALRRGSLQHKILEHLGNKQWPLLSDAELFEVIDTSKSEIETLDKKPIVRTDEAWRSLRRRMLRMARGVLEFERANFKKHPDLKTIACEAAFSGSFSDSFSGQFSSDSAGEPAGEPSNPNKPQDEVAITGAIDRIDRDSQGRTLIIDYKNKFQFQSFSQWQKNQYWQPLLYAYAFEKKLLNPGISGDLAGVFIFDITKKKRGNGLRINSIRDESTDDLFEIETGAKRRSTQTPDDLKQAYEALEKKIEEVKEILDSGNFRPTPYKDEVCKTCKWIYACRAPHLELLL